MPMTKDLRKIYSGSAIIFIGKIINAGAQYLLILIMGRFLGPAEVGLFFLGRAVMRFANVGGSLGFQGSLLKFVPEYLVKKQYHNVHSIIKFAFLSSFSTSLFIAIILYTLAPFLSVHVFDDSSLVPVIKLFSICLPLFAFLTIMLTLIRAFRDMLGLSIVENMILPGSAIIITLLLFIWSRNVEAVVHAYLISVILSIAVGSYYLKKNLPKQKRKVPATLSHNKILSYSMPLMGSGILGFFLVWMDTLMLGILSNAEEVGIYNGAARIALFSNIMLASVNAVFAPTISKLYTKGDLAGLESAYKKTVRWIIHISIPFYLVIFTFSNEIMSLYGAQFTQGSTALIILSVGQLVNISVGSAGYLLNMTGKPKFELMNNCISVTLNLLLNWYLIPRIGINGAAVATAISIAFVNVLRLCENYQHLRIHPFSLRIIWPFVRKDHA